MFDAAVEDEIRALAVARGIDPAALLAVAEVESGGQALTRIDGKPMPLILFEYHVFFRKCREDRREQAVRAGLAAPKWGTLRYPASQQARYNLLEEAAEIDRQAAYAACSWGIGQVLGENAEWLGYDSPEALAQEAMSGVAGQVRLMLRYVERAGLLEAMNSRDWVTFARVYNGPGYARNGYHTKLEAAYRRWSGGASSPPVLRAGSSGPAVRRLQRVIGVEPDGQFGPRTDVALRDWQGARGLEPDGVVGPATWRAIETAEGRAAPAQPSTREATAKSGGLGAAIGSVGAGGVIAVVSTAREIADGTRDIADSLGVAPWALALMLVAAAGVAAGAWMIRRGRA